MSVEVSLVIPAYNEESNIEEAVNSAEEELSIFLEDEFEIIIAEDGCTDRTEKISRRLASKENIRHIHFSKREGKGKAIEEALSQSKGDILAFMDADMATDMDHLQDIIEPVKEGKANIVISSRRLNESSANRKYLRKTASWGYNKIVQLTLNSNITDHQCGFKSFDSQTLEEVTNNTEYSHWFWDTEILVRANRNGYNIKEIPVSWNESDSSSLRIVRDSFIMGVRIFKFAVKSKYRTISSVKSEDTSCK